jgi:hypothetical protein
MKFLSKKTITHFKKQMRRAIWFFAFIIAFPTEKIPLALNGIHEIHTIISFRKKIRIEREKFEN